MGLHLHLGMFVVMVMCVDVLISDEGVRARERDGCELGKVIDEIGLVYVIVIVVYDDETCPLWSCIVVVGKDGDDISGDDDAK